MDAVTVEVDFLRDLEELWATGSPPVAEVDWHALGVDPWSVPRIDDYTREALVALEPPKPRPWRRTAHDYQLRVANATEPIIAMIAGRGTGKTHTAANVLGEWAEAEPGDYAIIAPTFGDAVTICVDGPSGFMRANRDLVERFNRNEYVIYLHNGSRIRLASADAPDRVRGWNFTGAWCIAQGEPVRTERGPVPVESVRVGDRVATRQGWRTVTATVLTKRGTPTLRIVTDSGTVRCTPDHPVWTVERGWTLAEQVRPGDTLLSAASADRPSSPSVCAHGSANPTAPRATVVRAIENASTSDVYDLTVDGAHEFYAGDGEILVHNCDETGSWKDSTVWYEGLEFALRIGRARRIITTTPRRGNKILKDLFKRIDNQDPDIRVVRASTRDNAAHLSRDFLKAVETRYAGTTLGRQELDGELLPDVEGALITTALVDATRVDAADIPDIHRVVVGVDPAVSNADGSDHTGIVVLGVGPAPRGWTPPLGKVVLADAQHLYVLQDASLRATVGTWARRVLDVADEWAADHIVAEKNNGGDLVESNIRLIADASERLIPGYSDVWASKGKIARAEPVAGLWEQHRVHLVRGSDDTTALEEEWTGWVPSESRKSPDRLDAMVWAAVGLMPALSAKGETLVRLLSAAG